MPGLVVVTTTLPTRESADLLARALVEERLAACVQVLGPVRSTYSWTGAVEAADEWRCEAKTTEGGWPRIRDRIATLHSYDVPEIVMARIEASDAYVNWVREQVTTAAS